MKMNKKVFLHPLQVLRVIVVIATALLTATAYSATKTILVVGDSLSAEYGLAHGTGWVPLLTKRLQQQGIDANVINASISGETTSGGKSRLSGLLQKDHPDIVILELGANDALRGLPLNTAEQNLRQMITASQKAHARVLLVGMQIPPNYGPDYAKRFANLYPKLAGESGTALVPFLLEGVAQHQDMFQADQLHPIAQAQPILLDNVWAKLQPMLKTTK